ncbi:ATP-dependent helicase HrpB [Bowmanella sp. Y26]|uniref:ATP-dependent helicase HrpB n=1 Tax=Bowmanella yangjiangensis TaxID=2811230 RepID=UPI001BDD30B5|nr:ATP-dependent helicase HrpB [Bowmanella yangjiangensis]MBT1061980.1 ATP-dependent helicase HrpB [Bowmanella yangjiangensis]
MSLPVVSIKSQLLEEIGRRNVILSAPPGAGKSTAIPLWLLANPSFKDKKILMLQPRRVAVRAIAGYLASQLGEPVGQTVGYRVRGENKTSQNTRLEILTEGLLTRKLQQDPELADTAIVIFDEFHERNLHSDFALALCLESQSALREDLRLLLMSATLDELGLERLLPDAAWLQCEGRSFPIDYSYHVPPSQQQWLPFMASVIRQALTQDGGVLAFLPGAGEIRKLAGLLSEQLDSKVQLHCLYGELGKQAQMAAVEPLPVGMKKLVLATNIAETSLTIEDISQVIDCGLEKVARFDLNQGVTHLTSQRISQASATQRAGRAGRVGPGRCYRLWGQDQHGRMASQSQPQILLADMAPLMLEAAAWGTELTALPLLDYPTQAQLSQARDLLVQLDAVDTDGRITRHGKALCQLGCHPRLANMMLHAKQLGPAALTLACMLAALLESKDPLKTSHTLCISERIDWLLRHRQDPIMQLAVNWMRRLQGEFVDKVDSRDAARLLIHAFPDRIAKSRGAGRYLLARGIGIKLEEQDPLCDHDYLLVADLIQTGAGGDIRAGLTARLDWPVLEAEAGHWLTSSVSCDWHDDVGQIRARKLLKLGSIVVRNEVMANPDKAQLEQIWVSLIREKGLTWLPLADNAKQLLNRIHLAAKTLGQPELSDWTDATLLDSLADWLIPYLADVRTLKQLQALDFAALLRNRLDWNMQSWLDKALPTHFVVPSGSRCALEYSEDGQVTLSVRMQEMYGQADTPTIAEGRIIPIIELLSPARRPLQKTRDLAGFWAGTYKDVQKEMKGRYPKHFWPDNPASAQATTRTKKAM